jgi:hypothetical protein
MKLLHIFTLLFALCFAGLTHATGCQHHGNCPEPKEETDIDVQAIANSNSSSNASAGALSNATALGGAGGAGGASEVNNSGNSVANVGIDIDAPSVNNDIDLSTMRGATVDTSNRNVVNHIERTQFRGVRFGETRVGSASKSISTFYVQGQTDDNDVLGRTNSVQLGVAIPWDFFRSGRRVDRAMRFEVEKLEDRNTQDRVRYRADMAFICMELHKYVESAEGNDELWTTCAGFVHNEAAERLGHMAPHNGGGSPRQLSPHNREQ